ncbi:DUF6243 family protein [Streptomyces hirsutus]|uniref:DUF6243 family protein n=2 Tax=Streptomyces hirsutus TaxID=35620 RepID=A0ABZ1GJ74_9ACTN|nr:DUF6243 family protein [Streptomyces hirsutus]WSD06195.1 DUF6243 family protein [Streptomyces hirsutus]WTD20381.1 DUF6243 family protein [Streptomyces hirsutus]
MSRGGSGNMLGVGGARQHLGRKALRGGGRDGRIGGGFDARAQKRELLRTLQERRAQEGRGSEGRGSEGGREKGSGKRA